MYFLQLLSTSQIVSRIHIKIELFIINLPITINICFLVKKRLQDGAESDSLCLPLSGTDTQQW